MRWVLTWRTSKGWILLAGDLPFYRAQQIERSRCQSGQTVKWSVWTREEAWNWRDSHVNLQRDCQKKKKWVTGVKYPIMNFRYWFDYTLIIIFHLFFWWEKFSAHTHTRAHTLAHTEQCVGMGGEVSVSVMMMIMTILPVNYEWRVAVGKEREERF